jgi:hypothetical protein
VEKVERSSGGMRQAAQEYDGSESIAPRKDAEISEVRIFNE